MLVIFDLDGTLLNTLDDLAACGNHLLASHGYPIHPTEAYQHFVGNGIRKLVERILPEKERTSRNIDAFFPEFLAYYDQHKMDLTRPYPGMTELLESLQASHISMAVATNKVHSAVAPLMRHFFPTIRFAAAIGNQPGIPTKPEPDIIYQILRETGQTASETIYVGDTAVDMETAARAGLLKVGVLWGFRGIDELTESGADYIVENPIDILNLPFFTENGISSRSVANGNISL